MGSERVSIGKNENGCSVQSLLAPASPQRRNSNSFHSALRQRTLQRGSRLTRPQSTTAATNAVMNVGAKLILS